MAIFKRILSNTSSRKSSVALSETNADLLDVSECMNDLSNLCWYPSKKLSRDTFRLVVFSEQGNKLLYDSDTVISIKDKIISGTRKSSCNEFQLLSHANDTLQMAKMVFGTMATSIKADSFKIHTLLNVDALMLSRIFSVSKVSKSPINNDAKCLASSISSDSDLQFHYSTIRSLDTVIKNNKSSNIGLKIPFTYEPPEGFWRIKNSSRFNTKESIFDDLSFSPNKLSRARRRQLSLKGLCDDGKSLIDGNRSRMFSWSSASENIGNSSYESLRQYGIALLFPSDDKDFIFQHILQIEKEIFKLISQIRIAISSRTQFLKFVYKGWVEFCSSVCLLHNSMRLKTPIWLSLTNPLLQDKIASEFCDILAKLSDQLNTKESHFFLSTLISTVLMNHLSWVASVVPLEDCSFNSSLLLGTSVIDSRRNPYNAIMAQFLELSGGFGNVSSKTVVFGNNPKLITEILFVLSYFIRCSSIENKRKELMTPDSLSPLKSFVDENSVKTSSFNSLFAEKNQTKVVPSSDEKALSISITNSSDIGDSSENFSITPPPTKIRAVGENSSINQFSFNQDNNISQKHYELIVDANIINDSCDFSSCQNYHSSYIESNNDQDFYHSNYFGHSLLAGVCSTYCPHFVLSGVDTRISSFNENYLTIQNELLFQNDQMEINETEPNNIFSSMSSNSIPFGSSGSKNFLLTKTFPANIPSNSYNDYSCDPVSQNSSNESGQSTKLYKNNSIVIVADCQTNTVKVVSNNGSKIEDSEITSPSESVASMLEEFVELYKHRCAPTFLISFFEDRLSSLLAKSNVLVRLVNTSDEDLNLSDSCINKNSNFDNDKDEIDFLKLSSINDTDKINEKINFFCKNKNFISMEHMSSILGCHCSDLRLILNVAAIYSPTVLSSAM